MDDERQLQILLVDDEEIVHQTLGDYLGHLGHHLTSAHDGTAALKLVDSRDFDLALVDVRMPGMDGLTVMEKIQAVRPETSVVIITGHGSLETAIQALRLGAADFLTKPVKFLELDAVVEKALRVRSLRQDQRRLRETIGTIQLSDDLKERDRRFVGRSRATGKVRRQIEMAVESACDTILLTGETGTGKEVVAREIHYRTERGHEKPFIAVSCPAIPDTLFESELFGHVKGSFTGATEEKSGCFALADGGTLLLDEAADLSPAAQAKLLRVLETRSVRKVGGTDEISVDVRVIVATNADLEKLIREGAFREDLYYRLNVFSIHLSPLRERREDIAPLAEHFLNNFSSRRGLPVTGITSEAIDLLVAYDFPGNARELRNLVERAAILCREGEIGPEQMVIERKAAPSRATAPADPAAEEREAILKALGETKWNRRAAAELLGMPYSTLRYKITKFGLC